MCHISRVCMKSQKLFDIWSIIGISRSTVAAHLYRCISRETIHKLVSSFSAKKRTKMAFWFFFFLFRRLMTLYFDIDAHSHSTLCNPFLTFPSHCLLLLCVNRCVPPQRPLVQLQQKYLSVYIWSHRHRASLWETKKKQKGFALLVDSHIYIYILCVYLYIDKYMNGIKWHCSPVNKC